MRLIIKRVYYFLFIIIFSVPCGAQTVDTIKNTAPDSAYIERMYQYLTVKLSLNNDIKGFLLTNNKILDIRPVSENALKLSANYRWLSLSLSATPKFIPGNKKDDLKGDTKAKSFFLNFNFRHLTQNLSYNWVKGYYLNNTLDYLPGWIEGVDKYIQFPNLVYNSFFGQTAYQFNEKFSFNALSAQTERQVKSAGTFMPSLIYNYYIVDDKTPLNGQNSSQKSNNLEALIAAGYFHTFVIETRYYISAGFVPAFGLITSKLLTRLPQEDITTHFTNGIFRFEGSFAFGYDAERFFAGTQFMASNEAYNQSNTSNVINSNHITYQIFAGYRFRSPKFLQHALNEAQQKSSEFLK